MTAYLCPRGMRKLSIRCFIPKIVTWNQPCVRFPTSVVEGSKFREWLNVKPVSAGREVAPRGRRLQWRAVGQTFHSHPHYCICREGWLHRPGSGSGGKSAETQGPCVWTSTAPRNTCADRQSGSKNRMVQQASKHPRTQEHMALQLPPPSKHGLVQARRPRVTVVLMTMAFMVRNSTLGDCVLIVEGKRGWFMFVMVPLAHNNILIGTATQCYFFCRGFQP